MVEEVLVFIPYSTDAPVYHHPIATAGLIATNVAIFVGLFALGSSYADDAHIARDLCLTFGFSFRPWQWITSTFMHADIVHLLGNMLCLWAFGLVVEGKIGWARFLPLYIGMGVVHCLIQQGLMLFADRGCSLGASGIIFALMSIAMIWAPRNEMSCVMFVFYRPFFFEISVLSLVALMIGMQLLTQMFVGITMTSQVLHLIGAGVGLPVGIVMLRRGWVDCEGWDLFSMYAGRPSDAELDKVSEKQAVEQLLEDAYQSRLSTGLNSSEDTTLAMQRLVSTNPLPNVERVAFDASRLVDDSDVEPMRVAIATGNASQAFEAFKHLANDPLTWQLPERELRQTIGLFHKQKLWRESIPAMVQYLRHFSKCASAVRLKLAHILIDVERRPRQALYVLDKLHMPLRAESHRKMLSKLRTRAEHARASIATEPLPEEW
jgi:membrane associated rhomboid family serine protease